MDRQTLSFLVKAALGYCAYLLGGVDAAMKTLIVMMVVDYVSGVMSAFVRKELSSKIGWHGIVKKVANLLLVVVGFQVDSIAKTNGVVRTAVIYFLVGMEGLSILENLGECGVPIPSFLKNALAMLKEKGDKGDEKPSLS